MEDVEGHVDHWRTGANEAIDAAFVLLEKRHWNFALFFGHLAIEKALKALVIRATNAEPPKIHNLLRLADVAKIEFTEEQLNLFAIFNGFLAATRYAEFKRMNQTFKDSSRHLISGKEVVEWLNHQ